MDIDETLRRMRERGHIIHRKRKRAADQHERFLRRLCGKERGGLKRCVQCGRERPIAQFSRNKGARDGRSAWCKPCFRAYQRPYQAKRYRRQVDEAIRDSAWLSQLAQEPLSLEELARRELF